MFHRLVERGGAHQSTRKARCSCFSWTFFRIHFDITVLFISFDLFNSIGTSLMIVFSLKMPENRCLHGYTLIPSTILLLFAGIRV